MPQFIPLSDISETQRVDEAYDGIRIIFLIICIILLMF